MRISRIALVLALALSLPGAALAQTLVTVKGAIQSLDSSLANVIVRSGGQDQLIVLPADVPVSMEGSDAPRTLNDLHEGAEITVDAFLADSGQLTARRVVMARPLEESNPPAGPTTANQVSVKSTPVTPGGVEVPPTVASSAAPAGPRFAAARALIGGNTVGEVQVDGHTVFRFRGVRGDDPYVRARCVMERLNSPGLAHLAPTEVVDSRVDGRYAVSARGRVLISVDQATARINHSTPAALAMIWAANLRSRLPAP